MARSKTRILEVDPENYGEYITAQIECENVEVVIAHYSRFFWLQTPKAIEEECTAAMNRPPVAIYGRRPTKAD